MTRMLPASGRPKAAREDVLKAVRRAHPGLTIDAKSVLIVGVRGYYEKSMGAPDRNDRGLYDDAIFVVGPKTFHAFNGNTDPSRVREGAGTGAGKGMARLKPGVWRAWRFGLHRGQYRALVQTGGDVTVIRDGRGDADYEHTGAFGINIHRGGNTTTGSEGCQTLPPDQWLPFLRSVEDAAQDAWGKHWDRTTMTYVLLDGWS